MDPFVDLSEMLQVFRWQTREDFEGGLRFKTQHFELEKTHTIQDIYGKAVGAIPPCFGKQKFSLSALLWGTASHAPSPQRTFLIRWYFGGGGVRIVGA